MKADNARIIRMRRIGRLLGIGCVGGEYRLVKALKHCKKGQLVGTDDVEFVSCGKPT